LSARTSRATEHPPRWPCSGCLVGAIALQVATGLRCSTATCGGCPIFARAQSAGRPVGADQFLAARPSARHARRIRPRRSRVVRLPPVRFNAQSENVALSLSRAGVVVTSEVTGGGILSWGGRCCADRKTRAGAGYVIGYPGCSAHTSFDVICGAASAGGAVTAVPAAITAGGDTGPGPAISDPSGQSRPACQPRHADRGAPRRRLVVTSASWCDSG
jgi:hypothetical protein